MRKGKTLATVLIAISVICSASQCDDSSFPGGETPSDCEKGVVPTWINEFIAEMDQSGNKGEVIRHKYEGKIVYSINSCVGCADSMTQVYDCQQNVVCLFGGIAGFNTCPDFGAKASDRKIIWQN